ncbi:MAG TPA: hypothetical protein VFT62_00700 [Mycobacteriales bacterium]|nr:hypothetical protein [Mycobacteriales bacterium]
MNRARLFVFAAASGVAVLAAGCGTTVTGVTGASGVAGTASEGSLAGPAATAPADSGLLAPAAPGGAGGGSAGSGGVGTTGGSGSTGPVGGAGRPAAGSAGAGGAGSGAGLPTGVPGKGVTATRIYVGITYTTKGDAANAALGASSITEGDQRADAQAVIDDINAHGGVAGRKLTPVWYAYDVTDNRPYAVQDAAACAKFNQDSHIFAALGNGLSDNYVACNTKAGAIDLGAEIIGPDQAYFRQFPYYFDYGTLSQDRMMADEVRVLQRLHYFTGWSAVTGGPASTPVKLGIIGYDTPNWTTPLRHVMLPALARAGHPVATADVQLIQYPQDNSQIAPAVAQIQSAVLKFRQDNVSHVIVLDANGSMMLQLLQNARGQRYYPRFGVNTATGIEALATTGAVSTKQFNGAVGLGWSPTLDLPSGKDDQYLGPATTYCIKTVEKRTGQHFDSTNAAAIALGYCDGLYLLRDVINRAGSVLNQQTARASLEALGAAFKPASMAAAYFSPSRHDGLQVGYDLVWNNACSCTRYVGQHNIP